MTEAKMRLTLHRVCIHLLAFLVCLNDLTSARKRHTCPIGFRLAYTKDETPICYREKGPEAFADKFNDCVGNVYTSKLYHSLNLTRTNKVLWTEYKSLYPGGPFIDWSYTESAGDILVTTYDVKYDASLGIDEELCVIIDPVSNFTATRCDEKHYRYCFVHPYPDENEMSRRGCAGFRGSWRFFSPSSNCLTAVTGVRGGTVRATWRQAQELCVNRGGSLLHRGWRYSNNPLLHTSGSYPMFPLGVMMNTEHDTLRYDADNDTELIPYSAWHFETTKAARDAVLGAIRDPFWYLVNSSYVFFDVICEKPAPLKHVALNLTVDWEGNILLALNETVKKSDINCFSDSLIYYPSPTGISKTNDERVFRVDPDRDGYYWCIQYDYKNYHVSTSNRALFIRSKESVLNLYACKIRLRKEYRFDNLEKLYKVWKKKLEEFIYYKTKYTSVYGDMNTTNHYEAERVLKAFKSAKPDLNWKDSDVIFNLKIKRLYLDARTALVHLMLNPEMQPLMPGVWDNVEVLFMKPAYVCKGFNSVPTLHLGQSVTTAGSRVYSCVGDFNEGVQYVETFPHGYNPPPIEITELYGVEDADVLTAAPDMTSIPEEQLDQLLIGLESLLQNDAVLLDNITDTFDQVNEILEVDEAQLAIPGRLLHLLDELGARVELGGAHTAITVRRNVAMLLADSAPARPVRGLRVATRSADDFAEESFQFIDSEELAPESLETSATEALVMLPASVVREPRRVSFVAFRNQRAFPSRLTVNSRVFSVNVENLTTFEAGELKTLEKYTNQLKKELIENEDKPIPLQTMEQMVIMIDQVRPAIISVDTSTMENKNEMLRKFLETVHETTLLMDMYEGQRTVFTHGMTVALVVESLEESPIRGVRMWYKRCGETFCCEPPVVEENYQFLTEEISEDQIDSNLVAVDMFEPLYGKACILIIFSQDSSTCTLRWIALGTNPQSDKEWTTQEPQIDYIYTKESSQEHFQISSDNNMQQVLDDLGSLLQNETLPFTAEPMHHAFDQVDQLLEDENAVKIPGELLHMLDEIGGRVILEGKGTATAVRDNVALLVADTRPDNPVQGMRVSANGHGGFRNKSFDFITNGESSLSEDTNALVFLPPSVTASSRRISFVVFRNGRAFHQSDCTVVNSHVLSVNVKNFTSLAPGEVIDIHLRPFRKDLRRNESRTCAYWKFADNGTGFWSKDGCEFIKATRNYELDICRCDHVTHFALIIASRDFFSEFHENALQIISVVGNSFSLFGITIIALTALIFKSWRVNESNKIWLHLCAAVFVLDICFLVIVLVRFEQNDVGCLLVGISLHYSVLATFCWMLVIAVLSYRKLVLVFAKEIRKKLWIVSGFAWGFPFAIIGILLAVDPKAYSKEYEEKAPSTHFCYPSGLAIWLTLYGPISVIWFVNWTLYLIITYNMYKDDPSVRRHSNTKDGFRSVSASCLLAFLCGIPWIFGVFAFNIVAAYLFTLTTSFQGFVLFVFFVLATSKTRNLWMVLFRGQKIRNSTFNNDRDKRRIRTSKSRFYVSTPVRLNDDASGELLSESRL
ncbi:unnamed protein product [Chilo suppressalis]|uniref:G-protein coupled receptors family 2 profile 2 domain-containing protein n=1 Tax=Chilo suppressalis TaxID=168631 RepID=A0ABN8BCP9_CHISP|nr:unnamed protein product [Chilo suppressalis]